MNPLRSALAPAVLVVLVVTLVWLAIQGAIDQGGLRVMARGIDGRVGQSARPGPVQLGGPGGPAVPLLLVVANDSRRTLEATRLDLLLPVRYRLLPRPGITTTPVGSVARQPVTRYRVDVGTLRVPPHDQRDVADTLWIQRTTTALRCVIGADSVPRFEAAPTLPVAAVTPLRIFYVLAGGNLSRPAEGLLTLAVDSSVALPPPEPEPPRFPVLTTSGPPAWPALDSLRRIGVALTHCGPLEDPVAMTTTNWTTTKGGRVFGLSIGRRPRKYVYDLNGDSIADLEVWDSDGSGRFRASSKARFRVPIYLYTGVPPGPAVDSTRGAGEVNPGGPGS